MRQRTARTRRAAQRSYGLLLRQHVSYLEVARASITGQADVFVALRAANHISNFVSTTQHSWHNYSHSHSRQLQSWSALFQLATSPSTSDKNDSKDGTKSPLENQKEVSKAPSATPGAQLCDAVLSSLHATKSKVEQSQTGEVTWRQRFVTVKNALISGTMVVVKFTFAVPGAIRRHIALPWADKVLIYKGWWTTIKKEAHHYWVCVRHCMMQVHCSLSSCSTLAKAVTGRYWGAKCVILYRLASSCLLPMSKLPHGL